MALVTIVAMLALIEFAVFGGLVGAARGKYQIDAPAISGNENFERVFRVHQNTQEQLVVFIPAIYAFGYFVSPVWAAGIGVVVLIGRVIYFRAYTKDPKSRSVGFVLTFLPSQVLVLGALIGAVISLI